MADVLHGSILAGKYRIENYLYAGRLGDHYAATRLSDGAKVAVRLLDAQLVRDSEAAKRFHRQIRLIRRLQHPGVVRMLDAGRDFLPFVVTEHLEGGWLRDVPTPLAPGRACKLALQIARAVRAIREASVPFGSLNPSNVFVTDGGDVKVAELGLWELLSNTARDQSEETTDIAGPHGEMLKFHQPHYLAPEHLLGHDIDGRADVYALGTMLYECLSGATPFQGHALGLLRQHATAPRPRVGQSVRSHVIPDWLDNLVVSMMAIQPVSRPRAAVVIQTLEERLGVASVPYSPQLVSPRLPEPGLFLSYHNDDRRWVRRLAEELERRGFPCWWDKELAVGDEWDSTLEGQLRACSGVVVLWSNRSVASRWVKTEARYGLVHSRLFPVLAEPCEIPMEFFSVQAAQISNWSMLERDEGFIQLMARFMSGSADSLRERSRELLEQATTLGRAGDNPTRL